jgi:predicted AAA+ superfamily ATPase
MERYLNHHVLADLHHKMVVLTGPRQVGKTTLAKQLMTQLPPAQYLNWDVPADRAVLTRQSWSPSSQLLVMDEIHKMPGWKQWLKGVVDADPPGAPGSRRALLVTGSARMETFRQSGESLAGRYLALRLHPISVREWCASTGCTGDAALAHLMQRGGFPEPCLAADAGWANRWRTQYITDLVREDVLEFSRVQEVGTMRVLVDLLRERVGSPLSLASIARDLAVAPGTLRRYLDILQALFIVFTVHPWHQNIARSLLQSPKVYFYDNGLVRGNEGLMLENAVATSLRKVADFAIDTRGQRAGLHYVRTKDGAEVDFALSLDGQVTHLIECKLSDDRPHRALASFAERFPQVMAVQLVQRLRQEQQFGRVQVTAAGSWLASLAA